VNKTNYMLECCLSRLLLPALRTPPQERLQQLEAERLRDNAAAARAAADTAAAAAEALAARLAEVEAALAARERELDGLRGAEDAGRREREQRIARLEADLEDAR
jgi:hypothetical protein